LTLSRDFLAGARACLPVAPGIAAFGVITGVATIGAGFSPWLALAMTAIVYAGTAQLAALQLLVAGAPMPVILLAGLVLNLRLVLYSLALAPHVGGASLRRKLALSYLVSDNGYAHFAARYGGPPDTRAKIDYLLGASSSVWVAWHVGSIAGIAAGARVPEGWHLEFVVTLTFLALAIAVIRDRALAAAGTAAGITAILAYPLPFRLGLLVAVAAGIAAGIAWERWTR
jgi:predicted branched-subunit amino acid permease